MPFVPALEDIVRAKWPYSKYVEEFPIELWSFAHFEQWAAQSNRSPKRDIYALCYTKIVRRIKADPRTVRDVASRLMEVVSICIF